MRKSIVILIAATGLGGLAVPALALASRYNRACQGGAVVGGDVETGSLHVGMSYRTAASVARRVGVEEFGIHARARDVPCNVAESVSYNAGTAWYSRWPGNDGTVGASWVGYSRGPYLGRFFCTGHRISGRTRLAESCYHAPDGHAGAITVRFILSHD